MPGRGTSIQLARLFGIRIGAGPSWFVVLFLIIYLLTGQFREALPGSSEATTYGVAVAAAAGFFVSLVAHELGHALEARRSGIAVDGIELWFFGGLAKLSRDTRSPGEELRVAGAGPAVTALIAGLSYLALVALGDGDQAVFSGTGSPVTALLGWLTFINGVLFVFNLIPAFPLDGGRLLRAAAWKVTGDREKGTVVSARLGQGFGLLLIAGGVALLLAGQSLDGLWFGVLGWFLFQAAGGAVASSRFQGRLRGVTAADAMRPGFEDRAGEDRDAWMAAAVTPDTPLEDLLASEPLRALGSLPVVDPAGTVVGVVTPELVRRALASVAVP